MTDSPKRFKVKLKWPPSDEDKRQLAEWLKGERWREFLPRVESRDFGPFQEVVTCWGGSACALPVLPDAEPLFERYPTTEWDDDLPWADAEEQATGEVIFPDRDEYERGAFGPRAALRMALDVLREAGGSVATFAADTEPTLRDAALVLEFLDRLASWRKVVAKHPGDQPLPLEDVLALMDIAAVKAFQAGLMTGRLWARQVKDAADTGLKVRGAGGSVPKVDPVEVRTEFRNQRQRHPDAGRNTIINRTARAIGCNPTTVGKHVRDLWPPRRYSRRKF